MTMDRRSWVASLACSAIALAGCADETPRRDPTVVRVGVLPDESEAALRDFTLKYRAIRAELFMG